MPTTVYVLDEPARWTTVVQPLLGNGKHPQEEKQQLGSLGVFDVNIYFF